MEPDLRESIEFAYEALRDTRDTIRAVDFKANVLLVVLAIAGASADKIAGAAHFLIANSDARLHLVWVALSSLGVSAWLVSLAAVCLILAGKRNPAHLVCEKAGANGVFFAAGAFRMSIWRYPLWPRPRPASLAHHISSMPLTAETIHGEVCFEHLKLVYIRDAKSLQLRLAVFMGFTSFLALCLLWISAVFQGFMSGAP